MQFCKPINNKKRPLKETPQVVELSEGELSDSEQEGPDSGTP